jgi:hypothetical protein
MELTLQKYGSYEKFEQATGGSLLSKPRIWSHVRKYMVKEGCLGEVRIMSEHRALAMAFSSSVSATCMVFSCRFCFPKPIYSKINHQISCKIPKFFVYLNYCNVFGFFPFLLS